MFFFPAGILVERSEIWGIAGIDIPRGQVFHGVRDIVVIRGLLPAWRHLCGHLEGSTDATRCRVLHDGEVEGLMGVEREVGAGSYEGWPESQCQLLAIPRSSPRLSCME